MWGRLVLQFIQRMGMIFPTAGMAHSLRYPIWQAIEQVWWANTAFEDGSVIGVNQMGDHQSRFLLYDSSHQPIPKGAPMDPESRCRVIHLARSRCRPSLNRFLNLKKAVGMPLMVSGKMCSGERAEFLISVTADSYLPAALRILKVTRASPPLFPLPM